MQYEPTCAKKARFVDNLGFFQNEQLGKDKMFGGIKTEAKAWHRIYVLIN